jgi:hypothetical protein
MSTDDARDALKSAALMYGETLDSVVRGVPVRELLERAEKNLCEAAKAYARAVERAHMLALNEHGPRR